MKEKSMMNDENPAWEPPRLTFVGKLSKTVMQGVGKISPQPTDPGEPRKVRAHE